MIVKEGALLPVACGGPQCMPGSVLQRLLRSMKIYNKREWDEMEDGVVGCVG
jgi:hypothetical protein